MTLSWLLSIVVMIVGFGFVIFWHELGHFLGARRAGIRVEQFAVGMGHAILSYRKGLGLRFGSSMAEFERRTQAEFDTRQMREKELRDARGERYEMSFRELTVPERYQIAEQLGLGETEYRLSMLPIGGYVKPTGQDDLRPAEAAAKDDPKSYAAATVGHRMVLISAGVIMNVILAAILFFVLFLFIGFESQKAVVGQVQSGSPAAAIGLQGGDELVNLNGHVLHDFTKVLMNVALLPSDEAVPLVIRRDGVEQTLMVQPRSTSDQGRLLAIGFGPAQELGGVEPGSDQAKVVEEDLKSLKKIPEHAILPGETITAINGKPVEPADYARFDRELQQSAGKPIELTIKKADGTTRAYRFEPQFAAMFNRQPLSFAGMLPRTRIGHVPGDPEESSAAGVLEEGDVILAIDRGQMGAPIATPPGDVFRAVTTEAGAAAKPLTFTVLRNGQTIVLKPIVPAKKIAPGVWGLGVGLEADLGEAVVGGVLNNTAAAAAGLKAGMAILSVNDQPVTNWADVHQAIITAKPGPLTLEVADEAKNENTLTLNISEAEIASSKLLRYESPLIGLRPMEVTRKTSNPLTAVAWGAGETRDLILQGYLTIRRVFGGSVPASNMSGPIGIFRAGTGFAEKGTDWFIWFLALVSANLAVVNFLPVPILDGWHFLSLLKEKITGKPVSERVQEVAQYVGLAMILSLLIFVSYNDIMRW